VQFIKPQLAALYDGFPVGKWLYEVKFDGYRMQANRGAGKSRFATPASRGSHENPFQTTSALRHHAQPKQLPRGTCKGVRLDPPMREIDHFFRMPEVR
jgi:hypothetical protein